METRTRFAPSPTGFLHVGGIRTALFAWLVAKQGGGKFILRLEDTDKAREVAGSEQHIMDSLNALGLTWDEGPNNGGAFGPYRQSERLEIYKQWGQKLVDAGRAYADPYSPEEVQQFREQAQKDHKPFLYRNHRPTSPPKWDGTRPLRFKSDPKAYAWRDAVMGDLKTGPEVIDDFILIKSDDYPTYNFAHIVDDQQMKISHIIRGQEYIASVPNYLNVYEALGVKPPIMATVSHILGPDGKKKLSKRDGAKDILDYIRLGYLPDALVSFIATLGWNDGTPQEVFTPGELIAKFSLDRVQKSGAKFDESRLNWINGHLIRQMPLDELYQRTIGLRVTDSESRSFWPDKAHGTSDDYKKAVLKLLQERLKYLAELPQLSQFFFSDLPVNPQLIRDNKQLNKFLRDDLIAMLQNARQSLMQSDFSLDDLTKRLNDLLITTGQKPAVLFSLIRVATTQAPASPGLADTLHILGKEKSLRRLDQQLQGLSG